jgi:hypothetical protein
MKICICINSFEVEEDVIYNLEKAFPKLENTTIVK